MEGFPRNSFGVDYHQKGRISGFSYMARETATELAPICWEAGLRAKRQKGLAVTDMAVTWGEASTVQQAVMLETFSVSMRPCRPMDADAEQSC